MVKSNKVYLQHILERVLRIEEFAAGKSEDDFLESTMLQDAVIRNFEVIGEASKNLSDDFKKQHSHVEWSKIAKMRDKLIHHYTKENIEFVWSTVEDLVPVLKTDILE